MYLKRNIDIVYHKAAQVDVQKSIENPIFDGNVNILGTINILEACKATNAKKNYIFIFSSSLWGIQSI